ncbi:MAG TPA: hypothetical protein VI409_04895 [Gaiellaceae bacterium]|nr:hypothetical protein [Gaiellaceae bacterium]
MRFHRNATRRLAGRRELVLAIGCSHARPRPNAQRAIPISGDFDDRKSGMVSTASFAVLVAMKSPQDIAENSMAEPFRLGEADRVLLWRAEALDKAGYDDEAVLQLALGRDVDLHQAVDLLSRGCPSETALRILL